ncbi:MAG: two-component system response regulator, partial [Planctomycetia bacterium]
MPLDRVAGSSPSASEPAPALILDALPDGVALVDVGSDAGAGGDVTIVRWSNERFATWCGPRNPEGHGFFAALGQPDVVGPDQRPFETALASGQVVAATLRTRDNRYLHLLATPQAGTRRVVAAVRDVTHTILEQQKRAAIHQAGQTLADLSPSELADMTVQERIELLKSNIIHYAKDLLQFDVLEIRLLDQQTGRLEPLLAEGMQPEAEARILYARPEHNGVTGFVAATGKSYFCADTTKDPLYLEGCK